MQELSDQLEQWVPAFHLFDPKNPFLQGGDRHAYGAPKPIEELIAHLPADKDKSDGADWLYKNDPTLAISLAEAAVRLYEFQAWTPLALGRAARNGVRNTSPLIVLARGSTLWRTIGFNIHPVDTAPTMEDLPWMNEGLTTKDECPEIRAASETELTPAIWYAPRIVRLEASQGFVRAYRMGPIRGERAGNGWKHPWTPSRLKEKAGSHFQQWSGKQAQRIQPTLLHAAPLLLGFDKEYTYHTQHLLSSRIDAYPEEFEGFWFFGYRTGTKVESWLDAQHEVRIPPGDLEYLRAPLELVERSVEAIIKEARSILKSALQTSAGRGPPEPAERALESLKRVIQDEGSNIHRTILQSPSKFLEPEALHPLQEGLLEAGARSATRALQEWTSSKTRPQTIRAELQAKRQARNLAHNRKLRRAAGLAEQRGNIP